MTLDSLQVLHIEQGIAQNIIFIILCTFRTQSDWELIGCNFSLPWEHAFCEWKIFLRYISTPTPLHFSRPEQDWKVERFHLYNRHLYSKTAVHSRQTALQIYMLRGFMPNSCISLSLRLVNLGNESGILLLEIFWKHYLVSYLMVFVQPQWRDLNLPPFP